MVASDFGLHWIELRSMGGRNLIDLSGDDLDRAEKSLAKYQLRIADIASPLFKTDWPGAPKSKYGSKNDLHGAAESTFKGQDDIDFPFPTVYSLPYS